MSRGHFCRVFTECTGLSPMDYILSCRMRLAEDLLVNSSSSITEIARRAGYQDLFFFSRHFKQHHGVTPSRFRSME